MSSSGDSARPDQAWITAGLTLQERAIADLYPFVVASAAGLQELPAGCEVFASLLQPRTVGG